MWLAANGYVILALAMAVAKLIIADSEKNANLYYATRFLAPDPFIFVQLDPSTLVRLGLSASLTIAQDSAPRAMPVGLHDLLRHANSFDR